MVDAFKVGRTRDSRSERLITLQPDFVAPVVGYLVSKGSLIYSYLIHFSFSSPDNEETSGSLFEVSGGWAAQTRWQQAGGHGFPVNKVLFPEDVIAKWQAITNFGRARLLGSSMSGPYFHADDGRTTNPASTQEGMERVCLLSHVKWTGPNLTFTARREFQQPK